MVQLLDPTRDRLSSPLLSLPSPSTELRLLELTVCGLETLRGREEVDFGVDARSDTRALVRREHGFVALPVSRCSEAGSGEWPLVDAPLPADEGAPSD